MKFKDKNILLGLRRTGEEESFLLLFCFVKLLDILFEEYFFFLERAHGRVPLPIYIRRESKP